MKDVILCQVLVQIKLITIDNLKTEKTAQPL